jgi:hypothetical protein
MLRKPAAAAAEASSPPARTEQHTEKADLTSLKMQIRPRAGTTSPRGRRGTAAGLSGGERETRTRARARLCSPYAREEGARGAVRASARSACPRPRPARPGPARLPLTVRTALSSCRRSGGPGGPAVDGGDWQVGTSPGAGRMELIENRFVGPIRGPAVERRRRSGFLCTLRRSRCAQGARLHGLGFDEARPRRRPLRRAPRLGRPWPAEPNFVMHFALQTRSHAARN